MHNIYIYILGSILITILAGLNHKEPVRIRSDTTISRDWHQMSVSEDFLQIVIFRQSNQGVSFVNEEFSYSVYADTNRIQVNGINTSSLQDEASALGWHGNWNM